MTDLPTATARIKELETILIELRHKLATLEEETQWCEGEVTLCGKVMHLRWRGQLFLSPPEPDQSEDEDDYERPHLH